MNHVIYGILLVLTFLSFGGAEGFSPSQGLIALIMGIGALKFGVIGFQFMNLRRAHRGWKIGFTAFTLLLYGVFMVAL